MNRPRVVAVFLTLAFVSCAFPMDTNPPSWRGDEGTTFQVWEFDADDNPAVADNPGDNPYGAASAEFVGSFPLTAWLMEDEGYQGVWKFEDYVLVDLPNNPEPNDYKEIWIQLTYYADEAADPEILTSPTPVGAIQVLEKTELPLQPDAQITYWHATYLLRLEPNPASEQIWIMPRDCTLFVDEMVIDTICAPEPGSLLLLAAVGFLARRR